MSNAKKLALTGVLCALAVVVMMMGGLIPLATFCCPALEGIVLIPIFIECGEKIAWCAWFVISALSLMVSPDKESALLFLFIGYYPVLYWRLEQIRGAAARWLCKLAVFNVAVIVMYALCIFLFKMEAILRDYREAGVILTIVTLLLGNLVILMYDRLIRALSTLYVRKLRKKLMK